MPALGYLDIYSDPYIMTRKQVKFPRSKKHRICKKWSNDERNFALRPGIICLQGQYIAHPDVITQLRKVCNGD